MGSRNTNNSRCFFFTKHKIRDSAKSTLCEYVIVVYTSIQNTFLYNIYIYNRIPGFVLRNNHSRCLLIFSPRCTLKLKNKNFEYFCRQIQNLNDASHLPHLAEYLFTLYYTCCELTEGSPRRNYTFTSSIRRAPSQPGIVRTRKRVSKVGKCVKFKQITYFSGDKSIFYMVILVH